MSTDMKDLGMEKSSLTTIPSRKVHISSGRGKRCPPVCANLRTNFVMTLKKRTARKCVGFQSYEMCSIYTDGRGLSFKLWRLSMTALPEYNHSYDGFTRVPCLCIYPPEPSGSLRQGEGEWTNAETYVYPTWMTLMLVVSDGSLINKTNWSRFLLPLKPKSSTLVSLESAVVLRSAARLVVLVITVCLVILTVVFVQRENTASVVLIDV